MEGPRKCLGERCVVGEGPASVQGRYVRYTSFRNNGWNINPGIWSYEGVAGAHIVFSGLSFLALGSINIL